MLARTGTETLRRQNRALLLATIRELGPCAHTDIAEWSGLSSATVSAITADLEEEGVLTRTATGKSGGRGRPRSLFVQRADCAFIAAIRITFDAIEYSLVDYGGTLKDRFYEHRPGGGEGVGPFARLFRAGLEKLLERAGLTPRKLLLVSISTKGIAAPARPVLTWSPVFEDAQIDFEALLPEWKNRIILTNETKFAAQSAALLNKRHAPGFPAGRSATLSLDNSIGLGLASDHGIGQVSATAPAFGHMIHQLDGPRCRCGANGCIEAVAGFYGILRTAFEVPAHTLPSKYIPLAQMDEIAIRARNGDRMAQYAFRQAGEALGLGISRLISLHGAMPLNVTGPGARYLDLMREGFDTHIAANLETRFGEPPAINIIEDEAHLIFEGNVQNALAELDTNVMAVSAGNR